LWCTRATDLKVGEYLMSAIAASPSRLETIPVPPSSRVPLDAWLSSQLERVEMALEGWCTRSKATLLMELILTEKPLKAVEIGIFGGRSLVPMAMALKSLGRGTITGIEAWSPAASVEYATNEVNDNWWRDVDYALVKRKFFAFVVDNDLLPWIKILETTSSLAAPLIHDVDFLHIDGGHSTFGASEDVINYVKKVKKGGIVVFDDVNWASTQPAVEIVLDVCDLVAVIRDENQGGVVNCAAFRKK
jgi:predicted O-methyltransferase YrrM